MKEQTLINDFRTLLRQMKNLPSFSRGSTRRAIVTEMVLTLSFCITIDLYYSIYYQVLSTKNDMSDDKLKHSRSLLHNYATMVSSINELKRLRGLDSGEKLDPREKIRATAGRVGLSVPKVGSYIFYNFSLSQ